MKIRKVILCLILINVVSNSIFAQLTENREHKHINASFPKNTILSVARIYIRAGGKDIKQYDSVTFRVVLPNGISNVPVEVWGGKIKNVGLRFWAKLPDVNNIYCKEVK